MDIRMLKISPNKDSQEITINTDALIQQVQQAGGNFWRIKPYGDKYLVHFASNGKDIGLPFNRLLIDGNGNGGCHVYGTMFVSKKLPGMTDDDIAMFTRIFSLEECAKPIEERVKLIKEYFPDGVESNMKMPDDYQDATPVTPSYTRPAVPVKDHSYIPRCPICGSPDIEKITLGQKAFGGIMFGLFSKTAKSQFKCNNCGAKF